VAVEMGLKATDYGPGSLQLVSFHSVSKGYLGECGLRGGYAEVFGIDDGIRAQLYKLASISLCSNTIGQVGGCVGGCGWVGGCVGGCELRVCGEPRSPLGLWLGRMVATWMIGRCVVWCGVVL
jgi:hypothetical protein